MNSKSLVQELIYEDQPIHMFEYNKEPAFLAQQVGDVLGVKDVARGVRDSKSLEKRIDYDVILANFFRATVNFPVALRDSLSETTDKITILYLSGFFLFVLRSNKDIAVPFTRWAIREAIPEAFVQKQKQVPDLAPKELIQLVKEERQGSGIARQVLKNQGWIDPLANKQLTF